MKPTKLAGLGLMLGAGGVAVWWLLARGGNTFSQNVTQVNTRANAIDGAGSTKTRAEILRELRSQAAALASELDRARSDIEAEYGRKKATATFDSREVRALVETQCAGISCLFDPYCGCDDQVLREYKANVEQWRSDQMAARVYPLEADLEAIQSEIDAVLMTA